MNFYVPVVRTIENKNKVSEEKPEEKSEEKREYLYSNCCRCCQLDRNKTKFDKFCCAICKRQIHQECLGIGECQAYKFKDA